MQSENYRDWERFEGNKIPSSLELFPIIWDYLNTDLKILDVGCGFGKTCIELATHEYRCVGIDINKTGVEWAKAHADRLGLAVVPDFHVMDALATTFADGEFDFQIWQALLTTIIGIDNRRELFRECYRILKDDGYIYMAVFGQTWHSEPYLKKYESGSELSGEEGSFPSYDRKTGEVEYYAHHYTEKELVYLIREVGLHIVDYQHQFFTTRGGNRVNGHVIMAQK